MWLVSGVVTGKAAPWALARGHGGNLSASLFQFLVFTALTVFAYVTVFAARFALARTTGDFPVLPEIPVNLFVLMELSVTTAGTGKGITVSYLRQGVLNPISKSDLTTDRDGAPDLTKAQMLIWTVVAVGVYLLKLNHFINAGEYEGTTPGLPDIDGALLVLMGASQGGYFAGKLVSKTQPSPIIEKLLRKAKQADVVSLWGQFLGDSHGNSLIVKDSTGAERELKATQWTDTRIDFPVSLLAVGKHTISVRVAGRSSVLLEAGSNQLEVIP